MIQVWLQQSPVPAQGRTKKSAEGLGLLQQCSTDVQYHRCCTQPQLTYTPVTSSHSWHGQQVPSMHSQVLDLPSELLPLHDSTPEVTSQCMDTITMQMAMHTWSWR